MATCEVDSLMQDGSGLQGLSVPQLKAIAVQLLKDWLTLLDPGADTDTDALLASACAARLDCADPKQLQVLAVQLLCEIYSS